MKLIRRGIFAGPSSGLNYAGHLKYIAQEEELGNLDSLLEQNDEILCTFICCDSPLPHVEEYYKVLGDNYFPPIHAVPELLKNSTDIVQPPPQPVFVS